MNNVPQDNPDFQPEQLSKEELRKQRKRERNRKFYKKHYEENKEEIQKKRKERLKNLDGQELEKHKQSRSLTYKKYYRKNKEEIERKRKERLSNLSEEALAERKERQRLSDRKRAEKRKQNYIENREQILAKRRQHYHEIKHTEDFKKRRKATRIRNKAKIYEQRTIYRHANRGIYKAICKKRRARLVSQNNQTITPDFIKELFAKARLCPYCGKKLLDESETKKDLKSLDHLIPISKGGTHGRHNVVICCCSCNARKMDKDFHVWLEELEEPYRTKSEKLYFKQYGVSPLQGILPLTFVTKENEEDNEDLPD